MLVDGLYAKSATGEVTYQPRPQEELDRIAALVRTAIGFDKNRGDQIEVVNLRFAEAPAIRGLQGGEPRFLDPEPDQGRPPAHVELAVIALLTVIVLVTVVRPLVRKVIGPETAKLTHVIAAAVPPPGAAPAPEGAPMRESQAAKMIELAKVNGQVQQQSLERIGEMVRASPSETVSVLRQWIHERT